MSADEEKGLSGTNILGEYLRLMNHELKRVNETLGDMKGDFDTRLNELDKKITEIKNIEQDVNDLNEWNKNVAEVWSVTQMKEAKDEIYKQKSKWIAAIAILGFVEIALGIWIALN